MKGAAVGEEARATMSLRPSERAEVRRIRYKVAVDAEDGRRRREDSMVEIRKSRREESLLKKRRDDLPPSVAAAASQMAHSSALQQKAAVIRNHDQEGTLSREGVMHHLVGMKNTLSRFNPGVEIDDYGNYNLEVGGVEGTLLANKSVLNLYFLDSGDYSTVPSIHGYGWIKASQQVWFQQTSWSLQTKYMNEQPKQKAPAPSLVYFHIPLPEFSSFTASNFTGVKKEGISSPSINSGFFASMVEAGDVKAAFIGHDHINDFCGKLSGIQLCYAGGFGYHAYGKAGWSRRARVVSVQFEKTVSGEWRGVKSIKTWKRLDDQHLTTIDSEVLWNKGSNGRRRKNPDEAEFRMGTVNAASYLYTSCVLPVYLTKFVIL